MIIFKNCLIASSNSPGKQILILILQPNLQNGENSIGSFWTKLKPLWGKKQEKNLFLLTPNLWIAQLIHSKVSLSVSEQLHCQFVKESTHFLAPKRSYKLLKWWGNMCISEYDLENFNFALQNVKSKIIIFKMIKLQTVGSYEYSKHLKSNHQMEIRGSICFILMFLKNSIKLLGNRHGIKLVSKTHCVCP